MYRAKGAKLGREVAIKFLPANLADDAERLKRFEREAKTLASLNHPNVAQIFGVDQIESTCFLVLELVTGASLEDRPKRGPMSVDDSVDVSKQIAEGLEAAHEAGEIHLDPEPANERERGSSIDSVLTTEAGRLLGTPTYKAPDGRTTGMRSSCFVADSHSGWTP